LAIVELTCHCNLRCPICFAGSGPERERTRTRSLEDALATLDGIVAAERAPDLVQFSGGEPTLHPDFSAIIDAARERPIRHLMVNTNGIRIANDPELMASFAEPMPAFEVYLQFDSLHDGALMTLRGARLSAVRQKALEALEAHGVSTTLVVTVARGVNDDQLGAIIEHALTWKCVRGVTL
jgi:uncharacterized radical SAM superfamily Fe-S cluster-containing enzyme